MSHQKMSSATTERWARLERYSRWRQKRLRIDCLPSDVLAVIVRHLDHVSVCNVLTALNGHAPLMQRGDDFATIPIEFRTTWICNTACEALERELRSLTYTACYNNACADLTLAVYAIGDWTPFAAHIPMSIATYQWTFDAHRHPTWTVQIKSRTLRRHVNRMLRRRVCATRVSLYHVDETHASNPVLVSSEIYATLICVLPHFLDFNAMHH